MWYYQAINEHNQKIKGVININDENELRSLLLEQNYYLTKIKKKYKNRFFYKRKISLSTLSGFCRHWSVLINSGMEINHALSAICDYIENKTLRNVLTSINMELTKGKEIYQAFMNYPNLFPNFFIYMLEIGEKTGKMEWILKQLAFYYEKENQIKQKVKNAFLYPKILLLLSLVVIIVLIFYVLPIFNQMFIQLGGDLPSISIYVNYFSQIIHRYRLTLGLLLISILILSKRQKGKMKLHVIDRLKLIVPIYKKLYFSIMTTRLIRGLTILLKSAIGIIESLEMIKPLFENTIIEKRLDNAIILIKEGNNLSIVLRQMKIFPFSLMEIISIGEKSGNLSLLLEESSPFFDEQVINGSARLTKLIEPLMVLFIAFIIIILLFSVFFPVLRMIEFNW